MKDMEQLKQMDIRLVDKSQLVDLGSVKIDESLSIPERVESFITQIKNPYCFRVGDIAVKVSYQPEGPTFQQNLEELFRTL